MTRTTTSDINYLNINENFPVAGEDNDTQTFRDNFDTIKTNFRSAQEDLTDIKANGAFKDQDNDFENNEITQAVFRNTMFKKFDAGIIGSPTTQVTVDYENGNYQVIRFSANMNIAFQNFPENASVTGPIGVGKVTLELYGDGTSRTITPITTAGTVFRKNSTFPGTLTVSSNSAPIIIEVWRHNSANIFLNYLGQFS